MNIARLAFSVVAALIFLPDTQAVDAPKDPAPTPAPVAWGKPTNGLQAGIRLKKEKRLEVPALELEFVIRNLSDEAIAFNHLQLGFKGESSKGVVTAQSVEVFGSFTPKGTRFEIKLAPKEEYVLSTVYILPPGTAGWVILPKIELQPGKYQIGIDRVDVRIVGGKDIELGTGYLDIEVPKK